MVRKVEREWSGVSKKGQRHEQQQQGGLFKAGQCDLGVDQMARLCDSLHKFLAIPAREKQKQMGHAESWSWQVNPLTM